MKKAILFLSLLVPVVAAAQTSAYDFGYDSVRCEGAPNRGYRPLIVVVTNYAGYAPIDRSDNDYKAMVSGPDYPNVIGYYTEVSNHLLNYTFQGVFRRDSVNTGDPRLNGLVLKAWVGQKLGAHLRDFDSNGDGKISTSELTILQIDNISEHGGVCHDPGYMDTPWGTITGPIAYAGYHTSLMTLAHELCHTLGIHWDGYYSTSQNVGLSLMSITEGDVANSLDSFHLDPYCKMLLGWTRPRLRQIGSDWGNTWILRAPQSQYDTHGEEAPILIWDPALGTHDFVLLEYRNYRVGDNNYDKNSNVRGLVAWAVKTKDNFDPAQLPSLNIPNMGFTDNAVYELGFARTKLNYGSGGAYDDLSGGFYTKFLNVFSAVNERTVVSPIFDLPYISVTFEKVVYSELAASHNLGPAENQVAFVDGESGSLDSLFVVKDGALQYKRLPLFGFGADPWAVLLTDVQGTPSAVRNQDGRIEVYVRGTDNTLHMAWETSPGGSWLTGSLGDPMSSDPAAHRLPDGRIEVFFAGADFHLRVRPQSAPAVWAPTVLIGGTVRSNTKPAIGPFQSNGSEVFWNQAPQLRVFSSVRTGNTWSAPAEVPGTDQVEGSPVIGVNADGRTEVFYRNSSLEIYHNWKMSADGLWGATGETLQGQTSFDPAVFLDDSGKLVTAIVNLSGKLMFRSETGGTPAWTDSWESMGGDALTNSPVLFGFGYAPFPRFKGFLVNEASDSSLHYTLKFN